MPNSTEPAYGMLALSVVAMLVVILLAVSVKIRAIFNRRFGIHVYDFSADLNLPPALHSRGYQFALYLTMKSLPREPAEPRRFSAPAAPR